MTRGSGKAHIARAALEAMCFQSLEVLRAMERDAGEPMQVLRVDGGACADNLLMQIQADLLQVPVERPKLIETTAFGAAALAGLATGFWESEKELWKKLVHNGCAQNVSWENPARAYLEIYRRLS